MRVHTYTYTYTHTCIHTHTYTHTTHSPGLQEVRVSSVEEAMLLLRLGRRHRHVASTRLNYQSSRSHAIFTIKMIKMVDTERLSRAAVNRISFVDLAGAERLQKTGASGVRVQEAGNINNSLLTLGKCIKAMRHNQNRRLENISFLYICLQFCQ